MKFNVFSCSIPHVNITHPTTTTFPRSTMFDKLNLYSKFKGP